MNQRTTRGGEDEQADPGPEDQKSYQRILIEEIEAGMLELRRKARGLLLSGLSAGLDIGFGVIVMAVIITVGTGTLPEVLLRTLEASAYSIGFIFVILGRSELFTEHTTLAALPVLAGQASVKRLLRLWGLVYVSNVVGAAVFAGLAGYVMPALEVASAESFDELARRLVNHDSWPMFLSAVLAGWLMGLLSWLVHAARETTAKLLVVWLVTSVIGFAGLHHAIVGTVEVLAGQVLGPRIPWLEIARFMAIAAVGNAVGGVIFVALVKYAHATQSGE